MLDAVLAGFLETVTEREFDVPLAALLRAHGYFDVHLVDGQFEFGKDLIAKKTIDGVTKQYVFQSKAGDIGLPQWTGMYGQLEMLRSNELAHPAFDRDLPRIPVLTTTGRLIGGAPLAIQEYRRTAAQEPVPPVEVWPHDTLLELLRSAPDVGLVADGALLGALSRIDDQRLEEAELERFSRRWITPRAATQWRTVLEASVVATRLRENDRTDLGCMAGLLLLRAIWASSHGNEPAPDLVVEQAELAADLFQSMAAEIWSQCTDDELEPTNMISSDDGLFVTYAVRCCRLIEILGLYGLRLEEGDEREAISRWLVRFLREQPGAAHPISDSWAISLVPATILAAEVEMDTVRETLLAAGRWLGDNYESGLGLADVGADPLEEVAHLLGAPLEHIDRGRRGSSYLATVLLDLAASFELPAVYDDVLNDVLAVDATPLVPRPADDLGQYNVDDPGITVDTAPKYAENWAEGDSWRMASHHDDDTARFYLGRIGRAWDWTAIGVALRDRHWVAAIRALLRSREAAR